MLLPTLVFAAVTAASVRATAPDDITLVQRRVQKDTGEVEASQATEMDSFLSRFNLSMGILQEWNKTLAGEDAEQLPPMRFDSAAQMAWRWRILESEGIQARFVWDRRCNSSEPSGTCMFSKYDREPLPNVEVSNLAQPLNSDSNFTFLFTASSMGMNFNFRTECKACDDVCWMYTPVGHFVLMMPTCPVTSNFTLNLTQANFAPIPSFVKVHTWVDVSLRKPRVGRTFHATLDMWL